LLSIDVVFAELLVEYLSPVQDDAHDLVELLLLESWW
jgi:hypothetical protein